jgi:hypothetical protein
MRSASAGSGSSSAEVTKYIAINVNHNYSRELVRTELGLLLDEVGPKVHNKGGQSRPTLRLMLAQWKQGLAKLRSLPSLGLIKLKTFE